MPTVSESVITGSAFCGASTKNDDGTFTWCPGNDLELVELNRSEVTWTFGDAGSTDAFANFAERSNTYYSFKDETKDLDCPFCGGPRQVSPEVVRPDYSNAANRIYRSASAEGDSDRDARIELLTLKLEAAEAQAAKKAPKAA